MCVVWVAVSVYVCERITWLHVVKSERARATNTHIHTYTHRERKRKRKGRKRKECDQEAVHVGGPHRITGIRSGQVVAAVVAAAVAMAVVVAVAVAVVEY